MKPKLFLDVAILTQNFQKVFEISQYIHRQHQIVANQTKKDLGLLKTDFLITKAGRSFHELIVNFIPSSFFDYFDAKRQIKLEIAL